MSGTRLYTPLALAGTLPFAAVAVLAVLGRASLGPIDDVADAAVSYGLAIVSFLAGAHWATQLYRGAEVPMNLFIASNAVLLIVWFAYLLGGLSVAILAQLLAFVFLLFVDFRLLRDGVIDGPYFRARSLATAIACPCLLVVLVAS